MANKLWHVENLEWAGGPSGRYDVFSDFVACCATEAEARDTHPLGAWRTPYVDRVGNTQYIDHDDGFSWVKRSETSTLRVTPLGVAYGETATGVVCASFHAG